MSLPIPPHPHTDVFYHVDDSLSIREIRMINCSLRYWRGSAQRLPLGEAVTKNGSSEPVLVTDEGQTGTNFTEQLP